MTTLIGTFDSTNLVDELMGNKKMKKMLMRAVDEKRIDYVISTYSQRYKIEGNASGIRQREIENAVRKVVFDKQFLSELRKVIKP